MGFASASSTIRINPALWAVVAAGGWVACDGGQRIELGDPPDAGSPTVELLRFSASSTEVDEGVSVFLAWEVESADQVSILVDPGEPLVEGSVRGVGVQESQPLVADTTFELVAEGPGGPVRQTLTVRVRPPEAEAPPRIITFRANPTVYQGRSVPVRVFWSAAGQVELTANGTTAEGFDGASVGSLDLEVDTSEVRFELTARRAGQTVTATQTVVRLDEEIEPNDTPDQASVPSSGIGQGRLAAGDRDLWVFDVPAQGRVTAEVDDGFGGCPFDSRLVLYRYRPDQEPALTFITQNDDISATNRCSRIDPTQDLAAAGLEEGLYVLELFGGGPEVQGRYRLTVEAEGPRCGNGTPELFASEACDDGNLVDGDGCSAQCEVETVAELVAPAETTVTLPALMPGALGVVRIEPPGAGALTISARLPADSCPAGQLTLTDGTRFEGGGFRRLAENPEGSCQLPTRPVAGSRFFVEVTAPSGGLSAQDLQVFTGLRGCGDALRDPSELCDDGNTASGDGCDASCRLEVAQVVTGPTPDLSVALPTADGGSRSVEFRLTGRASIRAVSTTGTCPSGGTLTLTNAAGRVQGRVQTESGCPELDPSLEPFAADLDVGTYFLTWSSEAENPETLVYDLSFPTPSCGNFIAEPSNDEECDGGGATPDCDGACQLAVDGEVELTCPGGICAERTESLEGGFDVARIRLLPVEEIGSISVVLTVDPLLSNQLSMRLITGDGQVLERADGSPQRPALLDSVPFFVQLGGDGFGPPIYLEVFRPNMLDGASFQLEISKALEFCGDGDLAPQEQCDDGNQRSGDGCSSDCRLELPLQNEAEDNLMVFNNDVANAQLLNTRVGVTAAPLIGALLPIGDVDVFRVDVPEGGNASLRAFVTSEPSGVQRCPIFSRARVALLTSDDEVLAVTDPMEEPCGDLNGLGGEDLLARDLPPGSYWVRVDRPGGGQSLRYILLVQLERE